MVAPTPVQRSPLEGTGRRGLALWDDTNGAWVDAVGDPSGRLLTAPISALGGSNGYEPSAVFTPAAASHVASDVVGGAQQFANAGPSAGGLVRIISGSLLLASGTVETTAWALHMYNVTPPSAFLDDAAWSLPSGDRAAYLGSVAFAQLVGLGATPGSYYIETSNIMKGIKLLSGSLWGYLVNGTTLTPQAVAHTVRLQIEAF